MTPPSRTPSSGGQPIAAPAAQLSQSQIKDLAVGAQALLGERWEVLEPLALGGMAILLQIRHKAHGGLFVAKVLRPEFAQRPDVLQAFRDEARHASLLAGHPNAVPVLDFVEQSGLVLMTMPYIEGEDLDQLLARHGPLPQAEALNLGAQVCSLLCHAESFGITHCDLSPGNIRVDVFGRYRVLDLGISHDRDSGKPYHALGGTPRYSSPEQLGGATPDARSDIYALGLVLTEALTGRPVFGDESPSLLKERHLRGLESLPAEIPESAPLARLLRRMLAREPKDRFPSCLELCKALSALGAGPADATRSGTGGPSLTSAAPRRPRLSPGENG